LPRVFFAAALCALAVPAIADWDPGDGHKMHFPQLPDHDGWDVAWHGEGGEPIELADDWTCTRTGPVTDVHFWLSARGDQYADGRDFDGDINVFSSLTIQIWSNEPNGPNGYSIPKDFLWGFNWYPGEPGNVTMREYAQGDQGWHNPSADPPDDYLAGDHQKIWQINITEMVDHSGKSFEQQEGEVYWLKIVTNMDNDPPPFGDGAQDVSLGWKTADLDAYPASHAGSHYMDDAVWYDEFNHQWQELVDQQGESMDLAFVITPEPASLALLAIGGLALIRRRRPV
jgi:hypothetical protein